MHPRFRISLSFAGDQREFVGRVAEELAKHFGKDRILYDRYHEAEFSRARLNRYLPKLYHEESELAVAFFSPSYRERDWCGLEWDAIFDLIAQRQDGKVMLCRFGRVKIEELYGAGFSELDGRPAADCVALILERLALNEGRKRDYYSNSSVQTASSAAAAAGPNLPPLAEPELTQKIQTVFGVQFQSLKLVFERNAVLREELIRRFGIKPGSVAQVTAQLMVYLHLHFLEAIGEFTDLYRSFPEKDLLLDVVSSAMYLALCPDYAEALQRSVSPGRLAIAESARQGVAEILICWTHKQPKVAFKALPKEKSMGLWDTTPQMAVSEVERTIMDLLAIDHRAADAVQQMETKLEARRKSKRPVHLALTEKDQLLINQITASGSPLRDLLLLIRAKGVSINPRANAAEPNRPPYDMRVEAHIDELRELVDKL